MKKEELPPFTKEMEVTVDNKKKVVQVPTWPLRGDRVMIYVHEGEKVSKGGIIIPETAQEKPRKGTIVNLGPGEIMPDGTYQNANIRDLKVGQTVWHGKYAGSEFDWEGSEFLIMRENDILSNYQE